MDYKKQICAIATEFTDGQIDMFEAAKLVSKVYSENMNELGDGLDVGFFISLESETDHLPVGGAQEKWSKEAIEEKKNDIESIENFYKDMALRAANNLLMKFGK